LIGGVVLVMEACWLSGVVLSGGALNHPGVVLAEVRCGERSGRGCA
jgi:hypothetical protein